MVDGSAAIPIELLYMKKTCRYNIFESLSVRNFKMRRTVQEVSMKTEENIMNFKKIVMTVMTSFLLSVVLLSSACQAEEKAVKILTEADADKVINLTAGDTIQLNLSSNASTGFKWTVDKALLETGVLILEDSGYKDGAEGIVGAPGTQYWVFKANKDGDVKLLFNYSGPGGGLPNEKTFGMAAHVGAAAEVKVAKTMTEADTDKTANLTAGDIIRINLESNPSTGYGWTFDKALLDTGVLSLVDSGYLEPANNTTRPAVGAPGTQYWLFKALKDGDIKIPFSYSRSWESVQPLKSFNLVAHIGAVEPSTPDLSISINGNKISYPVSPLKLDGRVLVPLRQTVEAIGGSISWDNEKQEIGIARNEKTITMILWRTTAKVNGSKITMEVPPIILNGATYIPIRFVAENFGYAVTFDAAGNNINLAQ